MPSREAAATPIQFTARPADDRTRHWLSAMAGRQKSVGWLTYDALSTVVVFTDSIKSLI
jgi:hypothetical protein